VRGVVPGIQEIHLMANVNRIFGEKSNEIERGGEGIQMEEDEILGKN